jgi:hypothetical protein
MHDSMNTSIEKTRSFGLKIVSFSPLALLILGTILVLGQIYIGFRISLIASMFVLGMLLSPLLVMQYKTGDQKYAMIYGGIFGFCGFIVAIITSSTRMNLEINAIAGLYGALCSLFGTSFIFSILGKRLIRYIKENNKKSNK